MLVPRGHRAVFPAGQSFQHQDRLFDWLPFVAEFGCHLVDVSFMEFSVSSAHSGLTRLHVSYQRADKPVSGLGTLKELARQATE